MTTWTWMRLTASWWLLRRAVKGTGWLLLGATLIAAWPLTLVTAAGYAAAWWRGWPTVRLRRAAYWALPGTAIWVLTQAGHDRAWRAAAPTLGRSTRRGWARPTR